jgi:hypothetical protein
MRRTKIALLFLLLDANSSAIFSLNAAEETAVVTEGKINVRGKPSLIGEVVTQLERGDKVTVLERITLDKPRPSEPTNWARIKLPANTPVWIFEPFVKEGKVAATRLNLRAGPGENHDVIGRLNRGDDVKAIRTVGEWSEIAAPSDAYAFIDLTLVRFDGDTNAPTAPPTIVLNPQPQQPEQIRSPAPPTLPAGTPGEAPATNATTLVSSEPAVTPTAPTTPQPADDLAPAIQPAPTNVAAATEPDPAATSQNRPESTPAPLPKVAQPLPGKSQEPLPKRVVRREGVIRPTKSIQAPTWFELANADTGKTINYLYDQKFSLNSGIKLKDYRGKKIMVTGEEAIDPRWPNTPILEIETLDVLP